MGRPFGFVGPTYREAFTHLGAELCVNLMPMAPATPNAAAPIMYRAVPGYTAVATLNAPIRALFYEDGTAYAVAAAGFYKILPDLSVTLIGEVANNGRLARIVSNGAEGHQVLVVSGYKGYIYDTVSGVFQAIADPEFPTSATQAIFMDGYFIVLAESNGLIALSSLFDGLAWDGLDVAIRSTVSDRVVAIVMDSDDLWLCGTKTLEPWRNTGATFPFEPIEGARIERGVLVADSVAKVADGFAWLQQASDSGPSVWFSAQSSAQPISTPAIDVILKRATLTDAEAYAEEVNGHVFYCLALPTTGTTLVYDFSTKMWHERRYWDVDRGRWEAHRARVHAFAFGRHLIGDRVGPYLFEQSMDTHTFDGAVRRWVRRTPHLGDGSRRIFHDRMRINIESGVSNLNEAEAQIMLRYSNDWGNTWSSERVASIGARGAYDQAVEFWTLGSSVGARVYEVSGASAVPVAIVDAQLDTRVGV